MARNLAHAAVIRRHLERQLHPDETLRERQTVRAALVEADKAMAAATTDAERA
jgi:hypothetical protein